MGLTIGIRREDKNEWERRVPLIPEHLARLQQRHGLRFRVQPSSIRAFADEEYRAAGIEIGEDLDPAALVFAVKEIPPALLRPDKTYVYFAHVIKGQPWNMPMLARLLELGCSLVDYEKITDGQNRRLIFFGLHAGYAGMIETLWCLGRRLRSRGIATPFDEVRHAYEYETLEQAKQHLREIGERIRREGSVGGIRPLVLGLAGYGNVSRGCQEMLECLQVAEIDVSSLPRTAARDSSGAAPLLEVVFKEEHMVEPVDSSRPFDLQEYYDHPEKYRGSFSRHLPHLDVLVNTIYWDQRYPRLVTRDWARKHYSGDDSPRLQVIGDISCDIEGSVELTLRTTEPDRPCFTYDAESDSVTPGCEGSGPVVMAVDNLPGELPRESSEHFSRTLRDMVPALAGADWRADFTRLDLPAELKKAVIAHKGELTPDYRFLKEHLS